MNSRTWREHVISTPEQGRRTLSIPASPLIPLGVCLRVVEVSSGFVVGSRTRPGSDRLGRADSFSDQMSTGWQAARGRPSDGSRRSSRCRGLRGHTAALHLRRRLGRGPRGDCRVAEHQTGTGYRPTSGWGSAAWRQRPRSPSRSGPSTGGRRSSSASRKRSLSTPKATPGRTNGFVDIVYTDPAARRRR